MRAAALASQLAGVALVAWALGAVHQMVAVGFAGAVLFCWGFAVWSSWDEGQ